MTTLTQTFKPRLARIAFTRSQDIFIEKLIPRRCMVISAVLILAGLGLPVIMAIQLIPLSLLLCFAGFALVAAGGIFALIFCGEP
jgi:hypothetical protein